MSEYSAGTPAAADDPDKALAAAWLKRIDEALNCISRKEDEARWKRCRQLLRGIDPSAQSEDGKKRMRTNLFFANLAAMRPQVYAKDPEFAVTPTMAVPEERLPSVRAFAKTAEQIVSEMLTKRAELKRKAKRQLTSAYATSVGWWKLCWQEDRRADPIITARLKDAQDNFERIQRLQKEAKESTQDVSAKKAELQQAIAGMQAEAEKTVSRGLALDFVPPDDVLILDASVREIGDYRRAEAMAHRVWMTREQAKQRFPGYDMRSARVYREGAAGTAPQAQQGQDDKAKDLLAVWEVWEQATGRVYTLLEGCKEGFARDPYSPTWTGKRWFPFFLLAFNDVDGGMYPPSDVELIEANVRSYNRARDDFERDRRDALPLTVARKGGALTDADIERVRNRNGNDVILVEGPGGRPLTDDLWSGQLGKIDPGNYDTSGDRSDIEQLIGGGDAARGSVLKAKTATEAEILAQGLRGRSAERTDIIEDMLSEAGAYALEICLRKMTPEEVAAIAGPEAMWPRLTADQVFEMVTLQVRGGSTGKPDRLQEQDRWTKLLPVIEKAMGQVAQLRQTGMESEAQAVVELVRETLRRFDERVDLDRFLPKPQEDQEGGEQIPPQVRQQVQELMARLQEAESALADRSAEFESKERQTQIQADAKVQATIGAAQVKADADVQAAEMGADAAVAQAAMQPALPQHAAYEAQPAFAPAAPKAAPKPKAPAQPDALSLLLPVLVGMQQQLAALSVAQQPRAAQPMELVPEKDPMTGKTLRYISRPLMH
jgi:hypothetical protein